MTVARTRAANEHTHTGNHSHQSYQSRHRASVHGRARSGGLIVEPVGNKPKPRPVRPVVIRETHEPLRPDVNWPVGHVSVAVTDDSQDECILITIHDVKHYLHATTARELSNMLLAKLDEWNVIARSGGAAGV